MLIKHFDLISHSEKSSLCIHIWLFIIILLPIKSYPATSNQLYDSISSNLSDINTTISNEPINQFLINYLQFGIYARGSYAPNLTSNKPTVFQLLFATRQTFDTSNMTLNSINAIASISAAVSAQGLYNSLAISPRIPPFFPNKNHYLNFNSALESNRYLATSETMQAGVNFAMLANYILSPYTFIKQEGQSDDDWLKDLSTTWSMIAQHSISYRLLHTSLKQRLIIDNLGNGISVNANNQIDEDTSYADLEEYQNMKRTHTQEWSDVINQSPEITLYRETLFSLTELARTLTIQYRQGQEILASISGKIAGQAGYVAAAKSIISPEIESNVEEPTIPEPEIFTEQPEPTPVVTPPTPTPSSSGSSFCFITSVAFGEHSQETFVLRKFRDEELLTSTIGQDLVIIYYITSPDIIEFIKAEPIATKLVRKYLNKLIDVID